MKFNLSDFFDNLLEILDYLAQCSVRFLLIFLPLLIIFSFLWGVL